MYLFRDRTLLILFL